jgi:hypothetical protein
MILAVVEPVTPQATLPASTTATDAPACCNSIAVVSPVIPPPSTATSTFRPPPR